MSLVDEFSDHAALQQLGRAMLAAVGRAGADDEDSQYCRHLLADCIHRLAAPCKLRQVV